MILAKTISACYTCPSGASAQGTTPQDYYNYYG
jgi:hypothetical protein